MSQLFLETLKKNKEHDSAVRYVINLLISENYTNEKLQLLLNNELNFQNNNLKYQNKGSKSVSDACKFLLNNTI